MSGGMTMHSSSLPYSGYSPEISMELEVEGQTFSIGSMSTDKLILRNPAPLPPTAGVARLTVDGKVRLFHIELHEGIDPVRAEQVYRLLNPSVPAARA